MADSEEDENERKFSSLMFIFSPSSGRRERSDSAYSSLLDMMPMSTPGNTRRSRGLGQSGTFKFENILSLLMGGQDTTEQPLPLPPSPSDEQTGSLVKREDPSGYVVNTSEEISKLREIIRTGKLKPEKEVPESKVKDKCDGNSKDQQEEEKETEAGSKVNDEYEGKLKGQQEENESGSSFEDKLHGPWKGLDDEKEASSGVKDKYDADLKVSQEQTDAQAKVCNKSDRVTVQEANEQSHSWVKDMSDTSGIQLKDEGAKVKDTCTVLQEDNSTKKIPQKVEDSWHPVNDSSHSMHEENGTQGEYHKDEKEFEMEVAVLSTIEQENTKTDKPFPVHERSVSSESNVSQCFEESEQLEKGNDPLKKVNPNLPLSQQLKKDADKSAMMFLKSLWTPDSHHSQIDDKSTLPSKNYDVPKEENTWMGKDGQMLLGSDFTEMKNSNAAFVETGLLGRKRDQHDTCSSQGYGSFSNTDVKDRPCTEKMRPGTQSVLQRSLSRMESLSDDDCLEEDGDYSNDLGGSDSESIFQSKVKPYLDPIKKKADNVKGKLKILEGWDNSEDTGSTGTLSEEKRLDENMVDSWGSNKIQNPNISPQTSSNKAKYQGMTKKTNADGFQKGYMDYDGFGSTDDFYESLGYMPSKRKLSRTSKRYAERISQLTSHMTGLNDLAHQYGFEVKDVIPDGNCMFSALVDQLRISGNFDFHTQSLRKAAVAYLKNNPHHQDGTHLESFLYRESWEDYLSRMEQETVWGDHMVLQACTDVLECKIHVYKPSTQKTTLEPTKCAPSNGCDLHIAHVGEAHFVSLRPIHWEDMWHLKAQIHMMGKNKKSMKHIMMHKIRKSNSKLKRLKKETVQLRKTVGQLQANLQAGKSDLAEVLQQSQHEKEADVAIADSTYKDKGSFDGDASAQGIGQASKVTEWSTTWLSGEGLPLDQEIDDCSDSHSDDEQDFQDSDVKFECSDNIRLTDRTQTIDPKSETSIPHLSYLLKYLIDESMIYEVPSHASCTFKDGKCKPLFLGSCSEGFGVELFNARDPHQNTKFKTPTIVGASSYLTILPEGDFALSPMTFRIDTSRNHPGYLCLMPCIRSLVSNLPFVDQDTGAFCHIPMKTTGNVVTSGKFYQGFWCSKWPRSASEHLSSLHTSTWPGAEVIDSIAKSKCMVIDRNHPKSVKPDTEWQFVFPDAEQILAKEALNADQKYIFKLFKIFVDFHLRKLDVPLKTTHLKSVMYRTCMEIPLECWSNNFGGCFLVLLDNLHSDIKARDIPNFFIPQNNMVDHFSEKAFEVLDEKLKALRDFPIMALIFLVDHHSWSRNWIIEDIVPDMEHFLTTGNLRRSVESVFPGTTIQLAETYIERNKYTDGCSFLQNAHSDMIGHLSDILGITQEQLPSLQDFMLEVLKDGKEDEEIKQTIAGHFDDAFSTTLVKTLNDGKPLFRLRDLTGDDVAGSYADKIIPSKCMDSAISQMSYISQFAYDLYIGKEYEDAKRFICHTIQIGKKAKSDLDVGEITDVVLRQEVEMQVHNETDKIDSVLLDCYCSLTYCNIAQFQPENAVEYIEEFEEVCDRFPNTNYFGVVMAIWRVLGNNDRAENCRRKASPKALGMVDTIMELLSKSCGQR